ncbi:MAG: hypothetical protein HY018_12735 [Hydrogenophilales bacterium]|nr:hypothetical protein [Hydrogenophilales bacterium]
MEAVITIEKKECRVTLSRAAQEAMNCRTTPLVAEVVVTLACCIRKVLNFREPQNDERLYFVSPLLAVALVSAEHRAHEADTACSLPPIKNWGAIAPRWLTIDFRNGQWVGDFGFGGAKPT